MKIIFLNNQRKYPLDIVYYNFVVQKFIDSRLKKYKNYQDLELYISFVSPQKIKKLKNELFNLNIITDVISVPIDTEDIDRNLPTIFGEIFICPEQANRQAKKYQNDFKSEISLLIIHGFLHLIGYDDQTEAERKIMRREEKKSLSIFRTPVTERSRSVR
jgi:probable rRNA maturation factor